ncbi:developmentally regulated GTP-binding protein 1 [Reticulomyxa filosa]|uniref:Developmentally regulated GTP-binding protein 1 n=2 Tax=Reticulomyxa filosa TaxID=46433 RepID=X6MLZ9_RETFI|nr:developmentally regulated GTP-binding protein 1 [Reticulomyxa filosa]|eukprot:ETO14115.1 developmentally regulated GTP-binding protein 1 [Reticulomyxa filosa]
MSISSIEAKIKGIEEEKNKATEGHLGMLKAKLAKYKKELLDLSAGGGPGGSSGGDGFGVRATGDARVGLVGFPSVGKSTLLQKLTGVDSKAADYEFTTLTCIPGNFQYKGCDVQLLDLPGIIEGAAEGRGRGRQVIGVARTCGLILIMLDASKPLQHKKIIEEELEGFGIRLNKKPPKIKIKKLEKGPVNIIKIVKQTHLDDQLITKLCKEFRYNSAEVTIRQDATMDDLIDALEGNRIYIPCLYVLSKIDKISIEELTMLSKIPHVIPISGKDEWNMQELLEEIWKELKMIRVYTKPKGQIPDLDDPVILSKDKCTIEDFCLKIHKRLAEEFNYAWVWGTSAKFNPQKVGKNHKLDDEDVVQIVKK